MEYKVKVLVNHTSELGTLEKGQEITFSALPYYVHQYVDLKFIEIEEVEIKEEKSTAKTKVK